MAKPTTSLRTYALTRLALVLPMVLILLSLVFFLMRVAPGDPVSAALGGRLSPKELQQRREAGGYDKPLAEQYVEYLSDVARLDFGHTITDNRPVTDVVIQNGRRSGRWWWQWWWGSAWGLWPAGCATRRPTSRSGCSGS